MQEDSTEDCLLNSLHVQLKIEQPGILRTVVAVCRHAQSLPHTLYHAAKPYTRHSRTLNLQPESCSIPILMTSH